MNIIIDSSVCPYRANKECKKLGKECEPLSKGCILEGKVKVFELEKEAGNERMG